MARYRLIQSLYFTVYAGTAKTTFAVPVDRTGNVISNRGGEGNGWPRPSKKRTIDRGSAISRADLLQSRKGEPAWNRSMGFTRQTLLLLAITIGIDLDESSAAVGSLTRTRLSQYSSRDGIERTSSGNDSESFQRSFTIDRFSPSFGTLLSVSVLWEFEGEVRIGASPHGPHFDGGSGTIIAAATLSLSMSLPTSSPLLDIETISGSHIASIEGPPAGQTNGSLFLDFSSAGRLDYANAADLAFFIGSMPLTFFSMLDMQINVVVSDPGPDFGMKVDGPAVATRVTVNYDYVPEPHALLLLAYGIVIVRRPLIRTK